jgi:hypothetical protein
MDQHVPDVAALVAAIRDGSFLAAAEPGETGDVDRP